MVPQPEYQFQPVRELELRRRSAVQRRQRQRARRPWSTTGACGGGYNVNVLEFDDRATRGGPGVYIGGFRTIWHYLNTDPRRPLTLNYFVGGGSNGEGQTFAEFNPSVTYRPLPALTINPGIRFSKNAYGAQWVENVTDDGDHYVFGAPRSDDGRADDAA